MLIDDIKDKLPFMKKIKVYAFVGPSGTGKSYRAQMVASEKNINFIIDDGLLIKDNEVIAGESAKKAETKVATVRHALFYEEKEREPIIKALKKYKADKILILGTSDGMVQKIAANLGLPEVSDTTYITDVATEQEMKTARRIRVTEGKHVIPVPTFEIKKDFSGYLLDPLQIFKSKGKGEKPYIQSPFEFSLHIEHEPGVCDKEKDNYIFLAKTFDNDEREDLVKALVKYIDPTKGTLFAQNVAFEKGRIKELAGIFPKYKEPLMQMYNRGFDLMWLVNTKSDLYEELGFDKERASLPNYYNKDLSGSFSIKKTLPVFSDLSYKDLTVKNGTEAIVAYANYNNMTKEEFDLYYEALRIYCQQDTWAMVVILDALRKLCQ